MLSGDAMPADDREGAATPPPAGGRPRPNLREVTKFFQGPQDIGSMAVTGLFLLAIMAFLHFAQAILLPVVLALLFYFLFKPVVVALSKVRIPRALGAVLVIAVLLGAVFTGLSTLQEPAAKFLEQAPEGFRKIEEKTGELTRWLERFNQPQPPANLTDPAAGTARDKSSAPSFLSRINLAGTLLSSSTLLNTATFLTVLLETIVLLFFLLAAGDRFLETLVGALPGQTDKDEAVAIVNDVQRNISRYLLTVTIINAGVGLIVATAMLWLGMPNPVLWGVVAGLFNFMPYFGPLTVFTVLVMAGLLSFPASVGQALAPPGVYLCLHSIESNLLTPAILGKRLTLNPLIIFLALMFWTWLWGISGALLSVPLLMIFKILCNHTRPLAPVGEFISG